MANSLFKATSLTIAPAADATPAEVKFAGQDATDESGVAGGNVVLAAGHGDQAVPGAETSGNAILRVYSLAADAAIDAVFSETGFLVPSAQVIGWADAYWSRLAAGVAAQSGWVTDPTGEKVLAAAGTNATATLATTGLSATLKAGRTYAFTIVLFASDDQAAEGLKFDLDGGTATATAIQAFYTALATAATSFTAALSVTALATDFDMATTTGVHKVVIEGTITVNAAGTFIPRFAQSSHTSGTATLARGSRMTVRDVTP